MHLFFKLFILVKHSACFGLSVHHQALKTAHTATGICQNSCCYLLLAAAVLTYVCCSMCSIEPLMRGGKPNRNM